MPYNNRMNQIFLWRKSCFFCFAGRISAMHGKQVMRALSQIIQKAHPCTFWSCKGKESGTTFNSEYPATLRSAQIGSRWSPTSGTRGTLDDIRFIVNVTYNKFFGVKNENE
jgi:hypothetical protein